jgi:hypothetical protein
MTVFGALSIIDSTDPLGLVCGLARYASSGCIRCMCLYRCMDNVRIDNFSSFPTSLPISPEENDCGCGWKFLTALNSAWLSGQVDYLLTVGVRYFCVLNVRQLRFDWMWSLLVGILTFSYVDALISEISDVDRC